MNTGWWLDNSLLHANDASVMQLHCRAQNRWLYDCMVLYVWCILRTRISKTRYHLLFLFANSIIRNFLLIHFSYQIYTKPILRITFGIRLITSLNFKDKIINNIMTLDSCKTPTLSANYLIFVYSPHAHELTLFGPLWYVVIIFESVIFALIIPNGSLGTQCEIVLMWISQNLTNENSTLVDVIAYYRQATNHYLCQCWPRFMSPYGATEP